jgi:hypothetical protein
MKQLQLIHKEPDSKCLEVLKSCIIEDKALKTWRIDKHTLLHKLPEKVVNEFLDFLGSDAQFRQQMLYMIKSGSLVIICEEKQT